MNASSSAKGIFADQDLLLYLSTWLPAGYQHDEDLPPIIASLRPHGGENHRGMGSDYRLSTDLCVEAQQPDYSQRMKCVSRQIDVPTISLGVGRLPA